MRSTFQRRLAPLVLAAALTGFALSSDAHAASKTTTPAATSPDGLRTRTRQHVDALFQTGRIGINELNLSAAQKAKLKSLSEKNAPVARAIWNNNSLSREQKQQKLMALSKQANDVFTPAQKQKIAHARSAAMGNMVETAMWVSTELKLTPDQQSKIRNIVMSGMGNGGGRGPSAQMAGLKALLFSSNAQISKVLTPAQRSKWATIQAAARDEATKRMRAMQNNMGA